ncbi:MAG: carboxypeptidase regulatory-like domain-containing protein [Planctomycetes bacterium]|nr:carboxypeptidase regulatory-like domain-containing protein [Planctomycetota bacterium]
MTRTSWLGFVLLGALALGGCLERAEHRMEVSATGACVIKHSATFDLNEVLAVLERFSPGRSERAKLTADDFRVFEKHRREEIVDLGDTELLSIEYSQDAEKGEVTETLTLRAGSMEAALRTLGTSSYLVWTHIHLDEASLEIAPDGICTFSQRGRAGGTWVRSVWEQMLRKGPPRPARAIPTSVSIAFPGKVIEADEGARVAGNTATWVLSAQSAGRGADFSFRVRFLGVEGIKPFHLDFEDVRRVLEEAKRNDAEARRLGPLDGDPAERFVADGMGPRPSRRLHAPEGTTPVRGRVTHGGSPLLDAIVSFMVRNAEGSYSGEVSVVTGADGRYEIPGLWPGMYGVKVHVGRHGRWLPDVSVAPSGPVVHDITLGTKSLKARLVDVEGQPVPEAIVWVHAAHGQFITFDSAPRTNAHGEVTIPYIAPGTYSLSATMDQATSAIVETVVAAEGEPEPVLLRLKAGYGRVDIQVCGRDGTGQQAYVKYLHPSGIPSVADNTDIAGRRTLYLTPGTWQIGLTSSRMTPRARERFQMFAKQVEVRAGETVRIDLTKP